MKSLKHRWKLGAVGAVVALALVTAACGNGGDSAAPDAPTGDVATASGAAELRAGLTALLQEHVYLASIATGEALGGRTDGFEAAAAALDRNSVALSEAIGSVYGDDAEGAFLELWRKHIGFFVDFTQAAAAGDDGAKRAAKQALDGYRGDFGAFLESANPNLTKEAVASDLVGHVNSLTQVIDAQAAESDQVYKEIRQAAGHMPMTAGVLAGAIVGQFPERFSGSTAAPASDLRAGLTALLQEHVYLAGIATGEALGGREVTFKRAADQLDVNSVALADAIGSVYGSEARDAFLELWRKHIGFFVDYTTAAASNDTAGMDAARTALDGYRGDFGAFLESANPNLTKDAVASDLVGHVSSLFAVIDAQAAGETSSFTLLQDAASHMPMTANVLAGAISAQFPDRFGA